MSLPCSSGTMALSVAINTIKEYKEIKDRKIKVAIPLLSSMSVKFAVQACNTDIFYYPLGYEWNSIIDYMKLISDEVDVVVVVHSGGLIDKSILLYKDFFEKQGIFLIEDISHSQCSELNDIKAGVNSDFTIFSMYATKSLNSGEGGIVAVNCNNKNYSLNLYDIMYAVWNAGRNKKEEQLLYDNCFNARVSEFQAVVMLHRIENYQKELELRKYKAEIIDKYIPEKFRLHQKYKVFSYYKYIVISDKSEKILKEIDEKCFTGKLYPDYTNNDSFDVFEYSDMEDIRSNHFC